MLGEGAESHNKRYFTIAYLDICSPFDIDNHNLIIYF